MDKHNAVTAASLVRMAGAHRAKAKEYVEQSAEWPAKVHEECARIMEEEAKEVRGQRKAAKKG